MHMGPMKMKIDSADPDAAHNLSLQSAAVSNTLAAQIEDFRQKTNGVRATTTQPLDPQSQEKLAALGYIAPDSNKTKTASNRLPDPNDKIEVANRLGQITFLMNNFRFQEAVTLLQQLIAKEPGMPQPYSR